MRPFLREAAEVLPSFAGGNVTGFASYVGIGDILSNAVAAWSLRAYSSATVGRRCINLRRDSDNAQKDFGTLPGTGRLDTASIVSFAGGANLFVTALYDQASNRDATQPNGNVFQPAFLLTGGPSGTPTMSFNGATPTDLFSQLPNWPVLSPPHFISAVALTTSATGLQCIWSDADGTGGSHLYFNTTNIDLQCNFNDFNVPSLTNTWYAIQGLNVGALNGRTLRINGTVTTGGASATGAWVPDVVGIGDDLGNKVMTGNIQEICIWNAAPSATQMANLEGNQRSFWTF